MERKGESITMLQLMIIGSTIIVASILNNKIASRFGIPMLLAFIVLCFTGIIPKQIAKVSGTNCINKQYHKCSWSA